MKAAFIESVGPAEVIRYGDLPQPTVRPGTVLVQVTAMTVDPVDTYIRSGAYPLPLPFPFVVGRDMTGLVCAVGEGVSGFRPGQAVWANNQGYAGRQGTFSEFVLIDEALLYPLPEGVDPQAAVAVLHSGLTAVTGLAKASVSAGETLFINGGSGNVGTAVLQLARACGVRVAVTAGSSEKAAWCRENGADRVIDYHQESLPEALREFAPGGVDVYWEATKALDLEAVMGVLAPGGRILVMAGLDRRCPFPVGPFYTHNLSLFGFTITSLATHELALAARRLNGWLARGSLRARIHSRLPLAETADAHRLVESGDLFGKVLVLP